MLMNHEICVCIQCTSCLRSLTFSAPLQIRKFVVCKVMSKVYHPLWDI